MWLRYRVSFSTYLGFHMVNDLIKIYAIIIWTRKLFYGLLSLPSTRYKIWIRSNLRQKLNVKLSWSYAVIILLCLEQFKNRFSVLLSEVVKAEEKRKKERKINSQFDAFFYLFVAKVNKCSENFPIKRQLSQPAQSSVLSIWFVNCKYFSRFLSSVGDDFTYLLSII